MIQQKANVSISGITILFLLLLNALILKVGFIGDGSWYWALILTGPLLLVAVWDMRQKKNTLIRKDPLIASDRYAVEKNKPGSRQCFVGNRSTLFNRLYSLPSKNGNKETVTSKS